MAVVLHPRLSSPERPRISVCIANFNGESMLAECIDSVLAQDCASAIEILVHDDASRDGSVALLRSNYPQVQLLASEANVGYCIGNNRMAAEARGEYLLLLNNDAALAPDAIRNLLREAEAINAPAILTLPQHDWETDILIDRGCLLDPFCNPIPNLDPNRAEVAYVIGACLWCPRDMWHSLGGFPEWLGSIAEDLYLCGVARLRGLPVRALQVSRYRHRQGATFGGNRSIDGLSTSIKRRKLSERNKTCALMILTPGAAMWPLLFLHLAALSIEGIALSLLARNMEIWREIYAPAIATPWREWPVIRAHRRDVQSSRTASLREWLSKVLWQSRKLSMLRQYGTPSIARTKCDHAG